MYMGMGACSIISVPLIAVVRVKWPLHDGAGGRGVSNLSRDGSPRTVPTAFSNTGLPLG